MKKIFITGGAGYVGSKLVPKLLELDYEVTVLDLMIYGENVLESHNKLKKVKGDIRDKGLLENLLALMHNKLLVMIILFILTHNLGGGGLCTALCRVIF